MSRLEKKLDSAFWFILTILPLIVYLCYVIVNHGTGVSVNQIEWLNDFNSFMSAWNVPVIGNAVWGIVSNIGGVTISSNIGVVYLAGYMVMVTLVHLLVDVLLFIPRFAMGIADRCYAKSEKESK